MVSVRTLRISHSAVVDAWRDRERQLRALGVDVMLLSARQWNEAGAMVPLVPRPGEAVRGLRTVGSHPALFLYDPAALWRVLGEDWDVLDIHEEPYALCTVEILFLRWLRQLLTGRPRRTAPYVVYSAQNVAKRFPWPFGRLERRVLRHAAAISVCSIEAGQIARDRGLNGPVELIPLGIDPVVFSPGTLVRPAAPGDPIRVGYAGRLTTQKGVNVLIDAALGDERLLLDLAGDGPCAAELRAAAAPLGERVRFRGALGATELPEFYRGLDVLAIPSLNTPGLVEQFGRVAVEAMGCGTPVVASDSGTLRELVGGAGLLVPPGDAKALRSTIVRVVDEPGLATELRAAGLRRSGECSWASVAERYLAMYKAAVDVPAEPRHGTPVNGVLNDDLAQAVGASFDATAAALQPPEVIVVAFGAAEMLRSALAPLAGQFAITVVDNSSQREVRDVTEHFGAVYLDPGRNFGFAAGVNYALGRRQRRGADVLLLNPDAEIAAEGVRALQTALHAGPRIASTGPAQVDGSGRSAKVAWPFPSPGLSWLEAFGLQRLRRQRPGRQFIVGSVLMLRRDALADVGRFDEGFFLYAEETDWAFRAHQRGWVHVLVPQAVAIHHGGGTSKDSRRRELHFYASQERYYTKHFGRLGWQAGRGGMVVAAAVRALIRTGDARQSELARLGLYLRGPLRAEAARADGLLPGGAT